MARETKVGLLAGLAFIICFAIILANRGRHEFINTQVRQFVDRPAGGPATARVVQASLESDGPARRSTPYSGPSTARDSSPGDRDASEAADDTRQASRPALGSGPAGGLERHAATGAKPAGTPLAASPVVEPAGERIQELERTVDALTAELRASRQASTAGGAAERAAEDVAPAVPAQQRPGKDTVVYHTVAAGDTLSNIAATYYGAKSPTGINAIYDANRAVLSDPHAIVVGMKLAIPNLTSVTPATKPAPPASGPEARPKREPMDASVAPPRPVRWYQVKKNDRYVTIAREQLGDESRWKEIYELNRSVFPDAGHIREGVRIRIPVVDVADARGGRR